MGGGARAAVSRSISEVRVEFGQADFPLGEKNQTKRDTQAHPRLHDQRISHL